MPVRLKFYLHIMRNGCLSMTFGNIVIQLYRSSLQVELCLDDAVGAGILCKLRQGITSRAYST